MKLMKPIKIVGWVNFFHLWNGISETKKAMALMLFIEIIKSIELREFLKWTALVVLTDLL